MSLFPAFSRIVPALYGTLKSFKGSPYGISRISLKLEKAGKILEIP
jgi:hypothetical protein